MLETILTICVSIVAISLTVAVVGFALMIISDVYHDFIKRE